MDRSSSVMRLMVTPGHHKLCRFSSEHSKPVILTSDEALTLWSDETGMRSKVRRYEVRIHAPEAFTWCIPVRLLP
jgi:hypothetical protein